jgi:DNA gyrase subunit A
MAKNETSQELTEEFRKTLSMTKILDMEVEEELKKSFMEYAMAVNKSRAIPDARDGLKPVHRRILYSMNEMGLFNDKAYRKCARIVGDVLGKYHPHGDSSVYDALTRLAQDFSINFPLVDGHGNFGSVDGDSPAAMRYTEARLTKLAAEMLRDLDKETVDFLPNFDGTEEEPFVLPSRYPNLLVNGADGIAVGMATNIPPHNLAETIDGAIAMIDNPDITIDELMEYIPAPDFPTGGVIMGRSGIRKAYRTGQGNIIIRSKCEIEDYQSGNTTRSRIVVTEIPYQVNKAVLIKTMADMVKDKRLEGISDIREESDRSGMRIVIDVKKDASPQVVLNTLYKHTNLQISDGINLLALVNKGTEPKVMNLREILVEYLDHQKEVIVRRTKFDLNKTEERAHSVAGLVLALANVDEVIAIIKASADKNEANVKLCSAFELDEKQANAILEMRLQRLTSL